MRRGRHDRPARRGARLPREPEAALGDDARCRRRVGVLEHDNRVLPAHLELDSGQPLAAERVDAEPGRHRAREADRRDAGVADDRVADLAARPVDDVQHTRRQSGLHQGLRQVLHRDRDERRRLHHHGVAGNQCRRQLPGRDRDREVPRSDQPDDPERLLHRVQVRARHARRELLAADPPALSCEEAQDVDRALHLAGRLGQRLPFLGTEVPRRLVLPCREQRGSAKEDRAPGRRRRLAPGGKRLLRGFDRCVHLAGAAGRDLCDDLTRAGRVLAGALGLAEPFPGDQVADGNGCGCAHVAPRGLWSGLDREPSDQPIGADVPPIEPRCCSRPGRGAASGSRPRRRCRRFASGGRRRAARPPPRGFSDRRR